MLELFLVSIQAPINIPTSTPLPQSPSPPSQPHTLSHSPSKASSPHKNPSMLGELDFKEIKTALFSASDEKKALILQALRWVSILGVHHNGVWHLHSFPPPPPHTRTRTHHFQRFTQSLTSRQYHSVMTDYITNDLLGSTAGDTYHVRDELGGDGWMGVIFFPISSGTHHWPTAVWVSRGTRAALSSPQCIFLALGRQELLGTQPNTCVCPLSTVGRGDWGGRGREWRRNGE